MWALLLAVRELTSSGGMAEVGKAGSSGTQSCAHAKACKTEASSWYGLAVETCPRMLSPLCPS